MSMNYKFSNIMFFFCGNYHTSATSIFISSSTSKSLQHETIFISIYTINQQSTMSPSLTRFAITCIIFVSLFCQHQCKHIYCHENDMIIVIMIIISISSLPFLNNLINFLIFFRWECGRLWAEQTIYTTMHWITSPSHFLQARLLLLRRNN